MMIKTFDNNSKKLIKKAGIFNKSFYNIGRDYKNGNELFTSLFSGESVTKKDIQSIKDMDNAIKKGATVAKAWRENMRGCTIAAKEQAKQCLMAKGSLSKLTESMQTATISAKAGQIALRGLAIAGNILTFMAITKGIKLAANGIDRLVNSAKYAKEAIKAATDSA